MTRVFVYFGFFRDRIVLMDPESRNQRLSRISTLWSLVYQAHQGSGEAVSTAQRALLERYGGTVHRYLLGALRDPDGADELFQEFCLRFLRGAFQRADQERGRFRDFVKTALFHLVVDYRKRQASRHRSLDAGMPEPAGAAPELADADRRFLESWREELLDRTWRALEQQEQKTGQPHHSVLRLRADQPLLTSLELAEHVGRKLGKPCSVAATRQALHRAREKFADILLQEVIHSLDNPTPDEVEQELADLGLLGYCESARQRRGLGRRNRP
jgi:RNA polymerase sigma-70 factor (ECF subfamily)